MTVWTAGQPAHEARRVRQATGARTGAESGTSHEPNSLRRLGHPLRLGCAPVVAVLLGLVLLDERLTVGQGPGGGLVVMAVAGLLVAARRRLPSRP